MLAEVSHLLIIGTGGHSNVVQDCCRLLKINSFERLEFFPMLHCISDGSSVPHQAFTRASHFHVAIGDNFYRNLLVDTISFLFPSLRLLTLVHPTAFVSSDAVLHSGAFIGPGSIVNSGAVISTSVLVNTRSVVEHNSYLDAFSSVAPSSTLCGYVYLARRSAIMASCTLAPNVSIGSDSIVGASSLVLTSIPSNSLYYGVPASFRKSLPAFRSL